jgi:hypothetical protein
MGLPVDQPSRPGFPHEPGPQSTKGYPSSGGVFDASHSRILGRRQFAPFDLHHHEPNLAIKHLGNPAMVCLVLATLNRQGNWPSCISPGHRDLRQGNVTG